MEDAQAEMESEQQKVLNDLGAKIMTVIDKYARDNAYALILDISSPQTPVLFATNQIDVTQDIVRLYDEQSPASNVSPANPAVSAPAPASPAPKPVGLTPAAPARKK
jgi:outer membrane protein